MWTALAVLVALYVAADFAVETACGRTWTTTHP